MSTKHQNHFNASLESLTVSQEGLFSFIRRYFRKRGEDKENHKAEIASTTAQALTVIKDLRKRLTESDSKLHGVSGTSTVELKTISGWFVEAKDKTKVPTDLESAIEHNSKAMLSDFKMLVKGSEELGRMVVSVYHDTDYSSDQAFEQTFLSKLDDIHKHSLTKFLKPGEARLYLGSAFIAVHPSESRIESNDGPEWMKNFTTTEAATASSPAKANGPEAKRSFTKEQTRRLIADTRTLLDTAETFLHSSFFDMVEKVENEQMTAYYYEIGEIPNKLDKHLSYMKSHVQGPAIVMYRFNRVVLGLWEHIYDMGRYQTQLVTRIVDEF